MPAPRGLCGVVDLHSAARAGSVREVERCLADGVDALDRELVGLIAKRARYMEAAARIKPDRDAVRDEWRIEDVVSKVKAEASRVGTAAAPGPRLERAPRLSAATERRNDFARHNPPLALPSVGPTRPQPACSGVYASSSSTLQPFTHTPSKPRASRV